MARHGTWHDSSDALPGFLAGLFGEGKETAEETPGSAAAPQATQATPAPAAPAPAQGKPKPKPKPKANPQNQRAGSDDSN